LENKFISIERFYQDAADFQRHLLYINHALRAKNPGIHLFLYSQYFAVKRNICYI